MPILFICSLLSGLAGVMLGLYLAFSSDLPDIPDLKSYRPKTVSTFYAEDGSVIGVFYRENRRPIPLSAMPSNILNAFVAAEDARFFNHSGLDWIGVFRAMINNLKTGNFSQGGSTITQQITRSLLLSREKKVSRKIREAILAFRIEKTLSKTEILELYLNDIYLGKGAYGIEAAAATYFGKRATELTLSESAMLAGLVSNPSKLSQTRNVDTAIKRRDLILGRMAKGGMISQEQCLQALEERPKFRAEAPVPGDRVPYFTEAVRQYVVSRYGENRLYNEGLQVWTTCDTALQEAAAQALTAGARAWEKRQGRPTGLLKRLDKSELLAFLRAPRATQFNAGDTVHAVVVANKSATKANNRKPLDERQDCTLSLQGDVRFRMELPTGIPYRSNDLLQFMVVGEEANLPVLEHVSHPPVQGALVSIENETGYVRCLAGGLDFGLSSFNRATQALRQPGSAFKPFVYAAGLEWFSYSPQTLVVDEPIAVVGPPREPPWIPSNSDGTFMGPITLVQALARSRNIGVIKLFMDVGPGSTIRLARNMGINSPLGSNLSLCLGVSEVTPLELTAAYTVFPNMGVRIHPVLVKKVVDRFGNVLEDNTSQRLELFGSRENEGGLPRSVLEKDTTTRGFMGPDHGLDALDRRPQEFSESIARRTSPRRVECLLTSSFPARPSSRPKAERVLSIETSYTMCSMLRETCVSGTASAVSSLRRKDLAGKTGTTDDCTDSWFVGFSPKYTTGVWMGHDNKITLGRREHGSMAALPVWTSFMRVALRNEPGRHFPSAVEVKFPDQVELGAGNNEPALHLARHVVPVDSVYFPVSAYQDPFTGQVFNAGFAPTNYYGNVGYWSGAQQAIRVLSANGEDLGFALFSRDPQGRNFLTLDTYDPYQVSRDPHYGHYDSNSSPLPPGANRFFYDAAR